MNDDKLVDIMIHDGLWEIFNAIMGVTAKTSPSSITSSQTRMHSA
jgi:hypothetical protein